MKLRKQDIRIVIRHALALSVLLGLALSALCIPGCASKVTGGSIKREVRQGEEQTQIDGGQERKAESGLSITVLPDGTVAVTMGQWTAASTQPSVRTATTRPSETTETTGPSASGHGAMPKVGAVSEGKLGGVSFDEMANVIKANWPLFLIFLVVAGAAWKLGSIPVALLSAGLALVAVIYPAGLLWLALLSVAAGIAAIVLKHQERIRELVRGGDNVIERFGDDAKVEMERAHSAGTKAAVRAAKGKA